MLLTEDPRTALRIAIARLENAHAAMRAELTDATLAEWRAATEDCRKAHEAIERAAKARRERVARRGE